MATKWAFPKGENSLVSDSEEFVRIAREKMGDDIRQVTREVVGRTGRGFMQVPLDREEQLEQYRALREADDPQTWLAMLAQVKDDPRALRHLQQRWANQEAQWREAQAQGAFDA